MTRQWWRRLPGAYRLEHHIRNELTKRSLRRALREPWPPRRRSTDA